MQKPMRSFGVCDLPMSCFVISRHDNDPRPADTAATDPIEHAKAAASRHHDIQNDQIKQLAFGTDQAFVSVICRQDFIAVPFEDESGCFEKLSIVVDYKNALLLPVVHRNTRGLRPTREICAESPQPR